MEPPLKLHDDWPELEPLERSIRLVDLLWIALGSLLAIPGVFLDTLTNGSGFFGPIVAGPVIEETLKPMGLIILLTLHSNLRLSRPLGVLAGALAGLVFASIENLIYLEIYIPRHTQDLVLWRWTVCVALHTVCSAIVGYGLAYNSGSRSSSGGEYSLLNSASPHLLEAPRERSGVFQGVSLWCLVIATLLHGTYNFLAVVLEFGKSVTENVFWY